MIISIKHIWKVWKHGDLYMVMAGVAAQCTNISVGLCQGYSAILLPQLALDRPDFTTDQASWIASLGVISNPIGALLGGFLVDFAGRRATLQSIAVPALLGWILIAMSDTFTHLCIGRFITGFTIGMSTATYIYVAEISTVRARGVLAALGPALVSFGIFLVYLLGSYFHWKTVAIVSAAISMIAPALLQWVPESPLWLASKGRLAEAYRAMTWIRQNAAMAHNELDDLYKGTTVLRDSVPDKLKSICRVSVLKPFLILLVFFMFQELSGIYIILYYAVDFIKSVGTNMNEFTASIIVGGLRVFMGIIGVALISNFSRRVLAITSGILLSATMLTAAMYGQPVVKLLCILCHVCASMIGFLQLPWIMSGELFPQKIRGIMSGTISSCAYLLIFTNIKTYPNLVALITNNGTLYLFGSCALLGAAFCYFFLPETKGKSLAEITREFEENNMKNDIETDVITYTNNSFDPEFTVTRRKSSAPNIFTIVLNEKGTNKRKLSI